jgi:glutamate racemase
MLVPLAEEGWTQGEVPRLVVRRYVQPLAEARVDVVVLGCTHYPLLRETIEQEVRDAMGAGVAVVDSARATAEETRGFLESRGLLRDARRGDVRLLVTDVPRAFQEIAGRFLGEQVPEVEQVDL